MALFVSFYFADGSLYSKLTLKEVDS